MSSKGRGEDSMLVHMTPGEVQGLQALAMKHGGSLTINPDTGLPEAGWLSKLLPMIAGFALAPLTAGTSLAFLGASPLAAAMTVGGVTGLATGSLKKGLLAGLGAYGGAGLQEGLTAAGAASEAGKALTTEASQQAMFDGLTSGAGTTAPLTTAQYAATATPEQIAAAKAAATPTQLLSSGAKAITESPQAFGQFAKQNMMPLAAAAAAPILAMEPTTPMPGNPSGPAYIRQKVWNGRGYDEVGPVDASKWGSNSFSDIYKGYNGGGIVALANGGMPHFDAGGFTQDQINAALKTELAARGNTSQADLTNYAKSQYGLTDAQINAAYDTIPGFNAQGKYDQNDYIANSVSGQLSPKMVVDAAQAANPYSAQNMANVDVTRPGHYVTDPTTGKPVALTSYSPGFDINNKTALTYLGELSAGSAPDDAAKWFQQNATAAQKAEADKLWTAEKARLTALDVAAGRLPDPNAIKPPTGLAQLNADASKPPANETPAARDARLFTAAGGDWNKAAALRTAEDKALVADPNYWTNKAGLAALDPGASDTTKWFAARGLGFDPIDAVIDNFLVKYKPQLAAMLPKDQEAAMRAALDKEKLNEADVIKATGMTIAQLAAAKRADGSIIVPGKLDEVPVGSLPGGVSGAGKTVVNANGTITTSPDIPRPESGSFAGMKDVRDVYTKGGGSTGYVSPSFDKIEDFNAKYVDRMTGDSRAAYDYLTGKKGATYPTRSTVSQIAKPYDEAVLGYPTAGNKKYNFVDGKYKLNPDYVAPIRDSSGKVSYAPSLNEIKSTITKDNLTGQALYDWATKNNVSAQSVADATGRDLSSVLADFRKGTAYTKAVTTDGTVDPAKVEAQVKDNWDEAAYLAAHPTVAEELRTGKSVSGQPTQFTSGYEHFTMYGKNAGWKPTTKAAGGGMMGYAMGGYAMGGGLGTLGGFSDGGRLLKGPGDGVSDSIPATIGQKQQPARLADGEFVVPARIVSELGNGSTDAGAKKLYAMLDRVQQARGKTTGKNKVAANSRADKYLPA
jgi:hypothetical protein